MTAVVRRAPEVRVLDKQVDTHRSKQQKGHHVDVRLKIAVVGPSQVGKTRLVNQILGHPILSPLDPNHMYHPTKGCRILDVDTVVNGRKPGSSSASALQCCVEVWDVSGSPEFEPTWPAVCAGLDGLIVCLNPESPSQTAEFQTWTEAFIRLANLQEGQVAAFSVTFDSNKQQAKPATNVRFNLKTSDEPDAPMRTLNAPVITLGNSPHPSVTDASCPARTEFDRWIASVFSKKEAST